MTITPRMRQMLWHYTNAKENLFDLTLDELRWYIEIVRQAP